MEEQLQSDYVNNTAFGVVLEEQLQSDCVNNSILVLLTTTLCSLTSVTKCVTIGM